MLSQPENSLPESADKATEKKNEWLFVNPYIITGVLGASLCFAWFFSLLIEPDLSWSVSGGVVDPLLTLAFSLVLAIAYFLIARLSNVLQKHRGALLAVALVCGVAATLPVGGGLFKASFKLLR